MSTNYREVSQSEILRFVARTENAWKDASIPAKQLQVVHEEMIAARRGTFCAPFKALIECMRFIGNGEKLPDVLEVGAAAGYNGEVIELGGFSVKYYATDYSDALRGLACALYPNINYTISDARALRWADDSFDIVLHAACLMHVYDWKKAFSEAVRVSKRYVILHRTPIVNSGPTRFYSKEAYGVECFEQHFSGTDIMLAARANHLKLVYQTEIFRNDEISHQSFVFEKENDGEKRWETA